MADKLSKSDKRRADGGGVSPPAASSGRMACSVTRHAPITEPREWRRLVCGIDTLDVGVYVNWIDWDSLHKELVLQKNRAVVQEGVVWDKHPIGPILVFPSGKGRNYGFHIYRPGCHVFIARRGEAGKTPNVYVSIESHRLWRDGVEMSLDWVENLIIDLGGEIERVQVSRCDLATDFYIPGGLNYELLSSCRVSKSRKTGHFMEDDRLETYYVGEKRNPIQARIYDNTKEIFKHEDKLWFLDVWRISECVAVWRVEFQMRRKHLKVWGVESLQDLIEKAGGLP